MKEVSRRRGSIAPSGFSFVLSLPGGGLAGFRLLANPPPGNRRREMADDFVIFAGTANAELAASMKPFARDGLREEERGLEADQY